MEDLYSTVSLIRESLRYSKNTRFSCKILELFTHFFMKNVVCKKNLSIRFKENVTILFFFSDNGDKMFRKEVILQS